MERPCVEKHLDLDWCISPVSIDNFIILPTIKFLIPTIKPPAQRIATQLCINTLPVCPYNCLRSKFWMFNDMEEVLEA